MLNSASAVRNEQVIKPQGALAPSVHCKKKQQVPPLRSGGTCCFPPPRNRFMECFRPSLSLAYDARDTEGAQRCVSLSLSVGSGSDKPYPSSNKNRMQSSRTVGKSGSHWWV